MFKSCQNLTYLSDTSPEKKPPKATPIKNIISAKFFNSFRSQTRFHCKSKYQINKKILFFFLNFKKITSEVIVSPNSVVLNCHEEHAFISYCSDFL